MGFAAWGDESGSHARRDPGAYVLAAAIADTSVTEELRAAMSALKLPSSGGKLHWVSESSTRRLQVVEAIAVLPVEAFVVVRQGPPTDQQERRRRKCLEHMLHTLTALSCDNLVLESRGPADDRRDRQLLDHLRRGRTLPAGLRLSHAPGPTDPVLWLADALCGAVTQERNGEPRYLKAIASRVTVDVIDA